jgi:hypothetical protein
MGLEGPNVLHSIYLRWVHFTNKTLVEIENYNVVLNNCTKSPKTKTRKAVKPLVLSTGIEPPSSVAFPLPRTHHLVARRRRNPIRSSGWGIHHGG